MLSLSSYQYDLPDGLIAQYPCTPRDSSRLMVLNRTSGHISEMPFYELAGFLQKGDGFVFNDTKVIPARLIGKKKTGGVVEIFLTEQLEEGTWRVLAKPSRKLRSGTKVFFSESFSCTVLGPIEKDLRLVKFSWEGEFDKVLAQQGMMPLPHYISPTPEDKERYQTVYATNPGAVAAPTAGLHFTDALLNRFSKKGIAQTHITLHVGMGTFKPVLTEDIRQHHMHSERFEITSEAAQQLNLRNKKRTQICVGTTCCRTLEAAATNKGIIRPGSGSTDIFIYPG
ncbi:MAG: tRNA preQ1(34) S-adenosylmethionine ribosyltransferase-isomerase QueA, partial [Waddliaceae bacterium]